MKKFIALTLAAITASAAITANAAFYERNGVPGVSNLNYYNTNYNPFYTQNLWSYCTWYCYGRAREIVGGDPRLSTGPASGWFNYNKANNLHPYSTDYNAAKLGAIICYTNSVAVVESVNSDGSPRLVSGTGSASVKTANFNVERWQAAKPFYFGPPRMNRSDFVGYIYLTDNGSSAPQAQPQQNNSSGFTQSGYVNTKNDALNVRSSAQIADGNIVGTLPKGATIGIDPGKSVNGWYYIKYGNLTGYVSGKYIVLM